MHAIHLENIHHDSDPYLQNIRMASLEIVNKFFTE